MSNDFSQLQFNPNHRQESLGVQALLGLRLVLVAIVLSLAWLGAFALLKLVVVPDAVYDTLAIAMPITAVAAFCVGAYGTWVVVDSLGWAKYISAAIIASFLIPYFRIAALIIVGALALDLVSKSGYRLTLWGKPRKSTGRFVPPPAA